MLEPFTEAVAQVLSDLRRTLGCRALWKDALPALGWELGHECTIHLHPYCQAVKAVPARLARCLHEDDPQPTEKSGQAPRLRICHAGVAEVVAPVLVGDAWIGTLFVGPFLARDCQPLHLAGANTLPRVEPERALAAARLAVRLLSGLDRERARSRAAHGLRPDAPPAIAAAVARIHAQPRIDLRAYVVAREVGLSPSRFVHAFATAAGAGFGVVLRRAVMARARELLGDGRSVQDTATALGFASAAAFSVAFRRAHRCPPATFKRSLLGP